MLVVIFYKGGGKKYFSVFNERSGNLHQGDTPRQRSPDLLPSYPYYPSSYQVLHTIILYSLLLEWIGTPFRPMIELSL